MRRRAFLTFVGGALSAPLASAQPRTGIHRVAVILTTSPLAEMTGQDPAHPTIRAFVHELRAMGYVEGRNLILERRTAGGRPERYPGIVAELVGLKSDAIVTAGDSGWIASARHAWGEVPIVALGADDPVKYGLAASLARPGGNLTGLLSVTGPENNQKRLSLLKEAIPSVSRVAYLATLRFWQRPDTKGLLAAAAALRIEVLHAEHRPGDLESTFAAIEQARPDALFVPASAESFGQRQQIIAFARRARLPGMYPFAPMVDAGGLMSYSISVAGLGRDAAGYVDRILKGARPGDLPMERPSTFELVINLRTARELGLDIPPSLLLRADRVIE
jgi:putative tryptophan/tyrosine transport system substrate-binding protein